MKRLFLFIMVLLCAVTASAQRVTSLSYWFDDQYESRVTLPGPFNQDLELEVDASGLRAGLHQFSLSTVLEGDSIGVPASSMFYVTGVTSPDGSYKYEFLIDGDKAKTGSLQTGTPLSFELGDLNLSPGLHSATLIVQDKNNAPVTCAQSMILTWNDLLIEGEAYRYNMFIDGQNVGSGTMALNGVQTFELDATNITPGMHKATVQVLGTGGKVLSCAQGYFFGWNGMFTKNPGYNYTYWIDNKTPVKGYTTDDEFVIIPRTGGLDRGLHRINMMFTDSDGVLLASASNFFINQNSGPESINGFAYWLEGTEPDTIRFTERDIYESDLIELNLPVPAFPAELSSRVKVETYNSEGIINDLDDIGRGLRLTVDNEYIFHYSCGYGDDMWYEDTLHFSVADYQHLVAHGLRLNGIGGIYPGEKPKITARSFDATAGQLELGLHAATGVNTRVMAENNSMVATYTAEQMQEGTVLNLPEAGRYFMLFDGVEPEAQAADSIRLLAVQTTLPQPLEVREPGSLDEMLWFSKPEEMTTFALAGDLNGADFATLRERFPAMEELSLPSTLTQVPAGAFSTMGSHLLVLDWNSANVKVEANAFDTPAEMQNLMVYAPAGAAGSYKGNLILGNRAEQITLYDELPVRIPKEFTAGEVSYTRHFDLQSSRQNKPGGWESLVLPFSVQHIESELRGELTPFGAEQEGTHPFWLAQLDGSANIFSLTSSIEANQPYLLLMPNNEVLYAEEYNISGDVSFTASEAQMHRTEVAKRAMGQSYDLMPNYQLLAAHDTIYTLNRTAYGGHLAGGAFVRNLRTAYPFEAYLRSHASPDKAPMLVAVAAGSDQAVGIERLYRDGLTCTTDGLLVYAEQGSLFVLSPFSAARQVPLYTTDGRLMRMLDIQPGTNQFSDLTPAIYVIARQKVNVGR